jgi:ferredoxin
MLRIVLSNRAASLKVLASPVTSLSSSAMRSPLPQTAAFSASTTKQSPPKGTIRVIFEAGDGSGDKETVYANEGDSILDIAHDNDIEIEGACGGEMACSTCHVILEQRIFDKLPKPQDEEEDMLDLAIGLTKTSRLGCQVKVTKDMDGMVVRLPAEVANMQTKN